MDLVLPAIHQYAEKFSSPENPLLKEIAEFTYSQHEDPGMLSGHLQGNLLQMISWMIRPDRVLEVGTFTGYSALCLASGLSEKGKLHTIELREDDSRLARSYFDRSHLGERIISHTGNALDIIPGLSETWDLVFLDADKPGYIAYFNLVFSQLRKNGFILADNIFFHGQVLENDPKGKNAIAISAFNKFLIERSDIELVILTVRDGLSLIRKL